MKTNKYFLLILAAIVFGWGGIDLRAQDGSPLQISRLVNFNFSESITYDNNIFRSGRDHEHDVSLSHQLQISHRDTRRYFDYRLAYQFSYSNYLLHPELNFAAHNFSAELEFPRPDYSLTFSSNFALTSDPLTLEVDAFERTLSNNNAVGWGYEISEKLHLTASMNYSIVRFPDQPNSGNDRFGFSTNLDYQILPHISVSVGYSMSYLVYSGTADPGDRFFHTIPMQIRFTAGEELLARWKLLDWIDSAELSIGYSHDIDNTLSIPITFNLSFTGHLGERTNWSFSASRNVDFSIVTGEVQFSTRLALSLDYTIGPNLNAGVNLSYESIERQGEGTTAASYNAGAYLSYRVLSWLTVSLRYDFEKRTGSVGEQEGFTKHRVGLSTGIPF